MSKSTVDVANELLAENEKLKRECDSLQEQVQKLAAENFELNSVMKQVREDWLSENDPQDDTDTVTPYDYLFYSDTQTDAVIREIGAKAVEELAAGQRGLAEVRTRQFKAQAANKAISIAEMLEREAAKLRAGEQP